MIILMENEKKIKEIIQKLVIFEKIKKNCEINEFDKNLKSLVIHVNLWLDKYSII